MPSRLSLSTTALDASLAKAKSKSKHWEREAKVGGERIAWMEKERDEAK